MAETKYGKYILREPHAKPDPIVRLPGVQSLRVNSQLVEGITCDFAFIVVEEPGEVGPSSHKHDADEFLIFLGDNPSNMTDLGAEVEICLGEEQEKHTINTPAVVYAPKGLYHMPCTCKKVDRPFYFAHILLAPDYSKLTLE
jgi:hypothetical protein